MHFACGGLMFSFFVDPLVLNCTAAPDLFKVPVPQKALTWREKKEDVKKKKNFPKIRRCHFSQHHQLRKPI
ncbi:hypothetical protein INR49_010878 [Caranx melampygus]|nr:hypothetical protein INR49_010878 [Caranx melampygus]